MPLPVSMRHSGSCESSIRQFSSEVHGVRQTPSRQVRPVWQGVAGQNGSGVQSGRQKSSVAQVEPVAQVSPDSQSGRQRPSTQCSPVEQLALLVHSVVSGRQKVPWHESPGRQSASPLQIGVHSLFTHAAPGGHSRSNWQVSGSGRHRPSMHTS